MNKLSNFSCHSWQRFKCTAFTRMNGFTLLELLISLAIVAILSSIAVPAYKNYIERARVTELLVMADAQKLKLLDTTINGEPNICSNAGGTAHRPLAKNVENIITWEDSGQYFVQVKGLKSAFSNYNQHNDKELLLEFKGKEQADMVNWECIVQQEYVGLLAGRCHGREVTQHNC